MMLKLTVYIPTTHLEAVKNVLFAAGAGRYRNYDRCCWQVLGQSQFRPLIGSNPHLGSVDVDEYVNEYRVEMFCPDELLDDIRQALLASHPYEEPAYDFVKIIALDD